LIENFFKFHRSVISRHNGTTQRTLNLEIDFHFTNRNTLRVSTVRGTFFSQQLDSIFPFFYFFSYCCLFKKKSITFFWLWTDSRGPLSWFSRITSSIHNTDMEWLPKMNLKSIFLFLFYSRKYEFAVSTLQPFLWLSNYFFKDLLTEIYRLCELSQLVIQLSNCFFFL